MKYIIISLLVSQSLVAQVTPKAKVLVIKNVGYSEVLNKLLDSGYVIEKKDSELQTVRTENKVYPRKYNAAYKISVRVKDSTAYITGTFTAPYTDPLQIRAAGADPLFNNDPIYNDANKKGETKTSSIIGYAFTLIDRFAKSFNRPIEYRKE